MDKPYSIELLEQVTGYTKLQIHDAVCHIVNQLYDINNGLVFDELEIESQPVEARMTYSMAKTLVAYLDGKHSLNGLISLKHDVTTQEYAQYKKDLNQELQRFNNLLDQEQ